jgi:predicted transcriptional regulator of viral defense system
MTAITRPAQAWLRVATIADRQHGVVSRDQLRHLGVKDGAISHAAATGRLHRVFHGAYALGHSRIGEQGRLMAATLACGTGAVVSHRSAGSLLGLLDQGPW